MGKGRESSLRRSHASMEKNPASHLVFPRPSSGPLAPRLYRRVDLCFGRINHVLAGYTLQTDEDYRQVSTEDLTTIAKLLYDIV